MNDLDLIIKKYKTNNFISNEEWKIVLAQIQKLVYYAINHSYWASIFSGIILENIIEDCTTLIFLRTLEKFSLEKNCKFSTFFIHNINFYLRMKYQDYQCKKRNPELYLTYLD